MNINSAFESRFIKADDLDGDTTFTIDRVEVETIGQGKNAETKPIVYFADDDRGWVLNKVNSKAIAQLYGPETDDWRGQPITLYATEVEYAGDTVMGIRVRLRKPQAAQRQARGMDPRSYAPQPDSGSPAGPAAANAGSQRRQNGPGPGQPQRRQQAPPQDDFSNEGSSDMADAP